MGQPALGIDDGRDGHGRLEQRAVLAAIGQLALPALPRQDGLPHVGVEIRRMDAALEQARRLAEQLLPAVAGQVHQRLVDLEDGALQVGDHDAVAGRFQRLDQQTIHLFQAMPPHRFADALGQLVEEGQGRILDDVVEGTGAERRGRQILVALAGNNEDGNRDAFAGQRGQQIETPTVVELVIEEDEIERGIAEYDEGVGGGAAARDGMAGPLERRRMSRAMSSSFSTRNRRNDSVITSRTSSVVTRAMFPRVLSPIL